MSSRRKPKSASSTPTMKQQSSSQPTSNPFLPTTLEAILLSAYPITLLLGSLYSSISYTTSTTAATYSPAHQSYQPPSLAPSYFATKSNFFNVYFVKLGWFWTTFALVLFLVTHPRHTQLSRIQSLVRFSVATCLWFFTTQWCFGPPLIDRSFRISGGACAVAEASKLGEIELSKFEQAVTNAECKTLGGTWSGGLDISGHVFLLVLGSTILWMEMLPFISSQQKSEDAEKKESKAWSIGVKFTVGMLMLMWWMLLMTATFFHTWTEKLAGLVVALLSVWLIYFLPRISDIARGVLGIPGVL